MPGSPPTSTTEPATRPPPSTRSSSARPVVRRSAAPAVTAASGRGFWPPGAPARAPRARGSGSASSTIVLHAPQPGHCPSQRGAAWPHCWQTKAVRRALSTMRALQVDKGGRTRHDRRVRVLDAELAALEDAGLRRRLRPLASASDAEVVLDGRRVLLLSSNNYLGLTTHPAVKAAACAAIERWGCGAGASRLISGHLELHAEVEAKLAALKGTEAALLFPSGYQANVGAITALVGRGDHVYSDALNHASIVDGCRLSRASVQVYPHRDVQALEAPLAATPRGGRRLILSDPVFSMDGRPAPPHAPAAPGEAYHSWPMVGRAHAARLPCPRRAGLRRCAPRARRARARHPPAHRAAGHGTAARHTHGDTHAGAARARARGLRRGGAGDGPRPMTDPATLAAWDQRYLWHPFTQMADWLAEEPLVIAEAEGTTLIDTRGRRYLDGVSSLWCNVHGHRHPALDAALRDQLARLAHSTLLGLANVPSIELARVLIEIAPPGLTRVFYSDAGATAVEAALRIALQYHQLRGEPARTRFASLVEAYHGDTLGAVGVGYSETFHRFVAGAVAPAVRLTPPHVFRWQRGMDAAAALAAALEEAERTLAAHGPTLAAGTVQPLAQGPAGTWVHPPAYLRPPHDP